MRVLSRVITSDSAYIYDLLNIGGRPCSAVKTKSLAETVNYLGQFFLIFFLFLEKMAAYWSNSNPGFSSENISDMLDSLRTKTSSIQR